MVFNGRPSAGCENCRHAGPNPRRHHMALTLIQASEEAVRSKIPDMWPMCSYWQALRRIQRCQRPDFQGRRTQPEQTCQLNGELFAFTNTRTTEQPTRRGCDRFLLRSTGHRYAFVFHEIHHYQRLSQNTRIGVRLRGDRASWRRSEEGGAGPESLRRSLIGHKRCYTRSWTGARRRRAHLGSSTELVRGGMFLVLTCKL